LTLEILIVLLILAAVILMLIGEWVPLEVLALLVMGGLATSGIVTPTEALAGFSNPAVVTIWAVFILSGGLTRTGIANILGRQLLKVAGRGEAFLVVIIMVIAGVLSAFMNNVAIAALMLPVVMDITRKTDHSPSTLLMPLAYGSLLGGLTTMIGTPPNILVSEALRDAGLASFGLFDYTPIGLIVMIGGIAFVAIVGTRLLPRRNVSAETAATRRDYRWQYELQERLFQIHIPADSALVGMTLARSRLGSALGLNVVGITRGSRTLLAPEIDAVIQAEDFLIVEGRQDRIQELNHWGQLLTDTDTDGVTAFCDHGMQVAEFQVADSFAGRGQTIAQIGFRPRYGLSVIALRRDGRLMEEDLKTQALSSGDTIWVHGPESSLDALAHSSEFTLNRRLSPAELASETKLVSRAHQLLVPQDSILVDLSLQESRLGDAVDIQILYLLREDGEVIVPAPQVRFKAGDRLVVTGAQDMISILLLRGLEGVFVETADARLDATMLENDEVGLVEVTLSPHSVLSGKTLGEIHFREKYGLSVLAIWRKGRAHRSELRDMQLRFGDALLLYGHRKKLGVLGREPDFLVLTETAQEMPREKKAPIALAIMGGVLLPVIFGWLPIYIAVVIGAAVMVMTRCLTMEEAYRFIEWKAVFLIAGMLPLGTALDKTGAARLLAEGVMGLLGPLGPHAVLFGLLAITFLATSIIPTAALVVLMVPIALKTAAGLGISPHTLLMGIAMAASSSFTSPISHPANVLVMGPGGYRFVDYLKVGVPLTLLILALLMGVLPILWPFAP
jgi:di/tricarboxylate transporter